MMAANRGGGVPPSLATPPTILPTKHKVSHTPLPEAHGPLSPALSFSHIYFYCCAPAECEPPSPFHARCCEAERLTADLSRSPTLLPLQPVCNVIGRQQQYHSGWSRRKPRIIFKMGLIKKKEVKQYRNENPFFMSSSTKVTPASEVLQWQHCKELRALQL